MIAAWPSRLSGYVLRDLLVNLALYVPLGACAYLVFRSAALAILLGVTTSFTVEVLQAYEAVRHSSMVDVLSNGFGSASGVIAGGWFREANDLLQRRAATRIETADPSALALLICWLAYSLFPYLPVLSPPQLAEKVDIFVSTFSVMPMIAAMLVWYIAGFLLVQAGTRKPLRWLAVSILLVPAQIFLFTRQPGAGELAGAVVGAALFAALHRHRWSIYTAPAAALVLLIGRGLAPFDFAGTATQFSWIPFAGFVEAPWQNSSFVLAEKLFFYGTAVWAVRFVGLGLWTAAAITAAVLGVIEVLQMFLPGRTPEITDPVLALVIALGLDAFPHRAQTNFQPFRNFGFRY